MVKKRGWKVLSGVFGSVGILVVGFIVMMIGGGLGTTNEVEVELKEWQVNAQPAAVKSGYHPFQSLINTQNIIFKITNTGSMTHEFVIVQTKAAPGDLPIEDDRVRYHIYAEEEEPEMWFHLRPGSVQYRAVRGTPPPEIVGESLLEPSQALGILVAPGETKSFTIGCGKHACSPGTSYVLFSNQLGDYQQGMYTRFTVTDPPFINTYWWVVLLVVVVVGFLVYLLATRVRRLE
jgi:hypothetical protein